MPRLSISSLSLSLVAFAAAAHAQPAPAPATTAEHPPTAPAPPPAEGTPTPPPAPAPAEPPKKLSVGKDSPGASFVPGLLMQGWYVYNETSRTTGAGETMNVSTSTFRLRRIEIYGGGDIIPGFVKYKFMFDPSRARDTMTTQTAVDANGTPVTIRTPAGVVSVLQDFYITFQSEIADLSIGQFKNPLSWEGYNSSTKIILPERSFVGNLLGGQRDIGLRLDKTFKTFGYSLNLFNGAGQNNLDTNNQKDISLRVEIYPIKGLTIAGATYDSLGYRTRAGTKDRWEGDLRYESGPFLFQSEYIRTRDVFSNDAPPIYGHGFYAAIGYRLGEVGSGKWKGVLQPAIRFAYYDPNIDVDLDPSMVAASNFGGNDERMDYEVGLNYYLRAYEVKFQASYDRQQFEDSNVKIPVNEVIVATQVSF